MATKIFCTSSCHAGLVVAALVLDLCVVRAVVGFQDTVEDSGRVLERRRHIDKVTHLAGSPLSSDNGREIQTLDDPETFQSRRKPSASPLSSPKRRGQHITHTGTSATDGSTGCGGVQVPRWASRNRTQVHAGEEVDGLLCRYYGPWSKWRRCNRRCQQSRVRKCRVSEQCGTTRLKERRMCRSRRGRCPSAAAAVFRRQTMSRLHQSNKRVMERVLYDSVYTDWSPWGSCTRSCKQRRRRRCKVRSVCDNNSVQETRRCGVPGSRCERRHKQKGSKGRKGHQTEATDTPTMITQKPAGPVPTKAMTTRPRTKDKQENKETRKQQGHEDTEDSLAAAQRTCGRRPSATRGSYRVVGGQEAQRLSWPWQVAILTRWEEQYCAGTLIAPQWVLTAAHCVRKKNRRRRIVVRTGEHDLQEFEGSEDDLKPEREFPHPDFDYVNILNDIALVRLKDPPDSRSKTGYACLPEPDFTPDRDSLCFILGWGKRRNTHLFGADVLHEAQVPLVSPKRCQKVFDYHINKTQVCAGYRRGGTDACAGDSGGPLLCPKTVGGETLWFITGITSYGEGCGRRGKYGIYTRVTSYKDWIAEVVSSYSRSQ